MESWSIEILKKIFNIEKAKQTKLFDKQ